MNLSRENMGRIRDLVERGLSLSPADIEDLQGHNEHLTLLLEARGRLMLGVEIERDQLKAEVDSLTREADRQYTTIEAYRKNAERYEWLRDGASVILNKEVGFTAESGQKIYSTMPSQRELDSAVDAAMSKESSRG